MKLDIDIKLDKEQIDLLISTFEQNMNKAVFKGIQKHIKECHKK